MASRMLFFLIFLIGITQSLPAQEWAPVGTRWYYTQYYFSPSIGLHVIESVGDTIINSQACRIFEGGKSCSFRFQYAYRKDRRIYYYNDRTEDFELLYDFNLKAGDTLKMVVPGNSEKIVDTFLLKIDSLSHIFLNNDSIQVQHVTSLYEINPALDFGNKIYENIGGNDFFVPVYSTCDVPARPLRCFEHPDLGLYQFLTGFSCDYVPVRERFSDTPLTVYPNPAGERLTVSTPTEPLKELELFDLHGRRVYFQNNIFAPEITLSLPDLPRGIYLIKVRLQGGYRSVQRFFKR